MPDPKSANHDLPGNDQADPDFYRSDATAKRAPNQPDNGNIGFDQTFGEAPGKALTGTGPFKNLKGGR